jgi:hypothetical protein
MNKHHADGSGGQLLVVVQERQTPVFDAADGIMIPIQPQPLDARIGLPKAPAE